eukprot:354555-Chlamydomonas_euryale.AAC.2
MQTRWLGDERSAVGFAEPSVVQRSLRDGLPTEQAGQWCKSAGDAGRWCWQVLAGGAGQWCRSGWLRGVQGASPTCPPFGDDVARTRWSAALRRVAGFATWTHGRTMWNGGQWPPVRPAAGAHRQEALGVRPLQQEQTSA